MLRVAVEDVKLVDLSHVPQILHDEIKGFQSPIQAVRNDVRGGSGAPVQERQRPDQGGGERCFPVFARDENKDFLESPLLRSRKKESRNVVADEFLPWFQQKRLAGLRAFHMNDCVFDDLNHKLRTVGSKLILLVFHVPEESLCRLFQLNTSSFFACQNRIRIPHDRIVVFVSATRMYPLVHLSVPACPVRLSAYSFSCGTSFPPR